MKAEELIQRYVELRDKKAEFKQEYDSKTLEINTELEQLENKLLKLFQDVGVDNVKTRFGTAYTSVKSSASVEDKEAFFNFVKGEEEWGFIDIRAAKLAIEQYKDTHQKLPPGVKWSEIRTVNVRRS